MTPPRISMARLETTSLIFMLVCVPDPVCQTTRGKWSFSVPSMTSSAALMMASPIFLSRMPRFIFACAAAFFCTPKARIRGKGMRSVPILKFSSERCVCAPQYLLAGTATSPIVSVSRRISVGLTAGCAFAMNNPCFD